MIDIETLRSSEENRLEILKDTQENFKAPTGLTKAQAAKDLGLTDGKEIKFTSAPDMIARWEERFREEKAVEVAQAKWEKTSFDPEVAPIACICIDINGKQFSFSTHNGHCKDEADLLDCFHEHINEACIEHGEAIRKPKFIGHYLNKFDLPFIFKRSVINNVKCCTGVKWVDAKHGYDCFDTMQAWAGYGKSISMDKLAKILGIEGKGDIDGSMVYDTWQEDPQKVIDYCHADVAMVRAIHERLK